MECGNTRPSPKSISRRAATALIAGTAGSLAAGRTLLAADTPRRGGILRVSAFANPSSLDPATGGAGSDHNFLYTIYDTLTEWEFETLKPKPGLAESWSFKDPTTLELNIRSGVTFHDGMPLDAEAVRFNLERNKSNPKSNVKIDLATVASIEATGPMQVTLKLTIPDSALPAILSDRAGMMVSPAALKASAAGDVNRAPVGTGAHTFVSWTDGEAVVTRRNRNYWKADRPYLDGIDFAIIPELTTGARSVYAGQNDLIYQLPPRQKAVMERSPDIRISTGPTVYVFQIFLNWGKPPFNDVRVRRALNFAIDRVAFVKASLAGLAEPAFMNLPSTHWAYDKSVAELYPYNPGKARQLLSEAGLKPDTVVELIGFPDQDSGQRQEVLIEQFRQVGLNVKFTRAPAAEAGSAFFGAEKRGSGLLAASTGSPDPSLTYSRLYTADSYYNAGRAPIPPELDQSLKDSRASEDLEIRRRAFAVVQRSVMENALVVPLAFQYELVGMNKRVQGYRSNLLGKIKFEDVWMQD